MILFERTFLPLLFHLKCRFFPSVKNSCKCKLVPVKREARKIKSQSKKEDLEPNDRQIYFSPQKVFSIIGYYVFKFIRFI